MGYFNYDYYGNKKHSKMFLTTMNKVMIGSITDYKSLEFTFKDNDVNEASFVIYQYSNGEKNDIYDDIREMSLIEIEQLGSWMITDISILSDANMKDEYKKVALKSLEYELCSRKVYDISGVYRLYDVANPNSSLLHKIANDCNWNVGTVDNDLQSMWRSFDSDEEYIYSFLTSKVSQSYDCIFEFNTNTRTINVVKADNHGEHTDIVISRKNIMSSCIRESQIKDIVTKLVVKGDDTVDIRSVNPTGMNYIVNFDYFKNTNYMSQGLIDALDDWEDACDTARVSYTSNLTTLKTKQSELATLQTDLVTLQSERNAQQETVNVILKSNYNQPPISGHASYTNYRNALNNISSYDTQVANKKSAISTKESEISSINASLTYISGGLSMSNHLSSTQLEELNSFIRENEDYVDDTFIATDTMTDEEITEMKIELLANGTKELARISQPQYTISTDLKNLFTIRENKNTCTDYSEWRDKFKDGNIVTIICNDNYNISARISELKINTEDDEKINVVITNRNRYDTFTSKLAEQVSSASAGAKSYFLGKYGYDKSKSMNNDISNIINDGLTTSVNSLKNNDNQEMVLDSYGLWMKRWLPAQSKYDDCMSVLTSNNLLISNDGMKNARTGLGKVTVNGNTYYGLLGEVIVGNLILGENLGIRNNSGTYTINDNGFNATNGNYSVVINPSTPSSIFNITVNGVNALYVDAPNNKLVYNGEINATSGTFSGIINGGSININNRFMVNSNGDVTLPDNATISWSNITNQPTIPILPGYITSTKITSTTIESPTISAATINGCTLNSYLYDSLNNIDFKTTIEGGTISSSSIRLYPINLITHDFSTTSGWMNINPSQIFMFGSNGTAIFSVNDVGNNAKLYCSQITCDLINGYRPLTPLHLDEALTNYVTFNDLNSIATIANTAMSTASEALSTANTAYGGVREIMARLAAAGI